MMTAHSPLTRVCKGHCLLGDLTFESAAYVARYVVKKINGQQKFLHYAIINHETGEFHSLKQEYTTMSRRPGIAPQHLVKTSEVNKSPDFCFLKIFLSGNP
jgi:hypothetical protein